MVCKGGIGCIPQKMAKIKKAVPFLQYLLFCQCNATRCMKLLSLAKMQTWIHGLKYLMLLAGIPKIWRGNKTANIIVKTTLSMLSFCSMYLTDCNYTVNMIQVTAT